jgi:hypothetical protein
MLKVIKGDGSQEKFSEKKFHRALKGAGVSQPHIEDVTERIKKKFSKPVRTYTLYKTTFDILKELEPAEAGRYSLKKALQDMGPTGFPFEKLVARIYEHKGYTIQVGKILQGKCITHEIDVIAYKNPENFIIIECKFFNAPSIFMSVHTPLYVNSRFYDVYGSSKNWNEYHLKDVSQCAVATNAKFSFQSVDYSDCKNIQLLGWNYPRDKGIEYYIRKYQLYPVTTLLSLSNKEKKILMRENIILCKELKENTQKLYSFGFEKDKIEHIINECERICTHFE